MSYDALDAEGKAVLQGLYANYVNLQNIAASQTPWATHQQMDINTFTANYLRHQTITNGSPGQPFALSTPPADSQMQNTLSGRGTAAAPNVVTNAQQANMSLDTAMEDSFTVPDPRIVELTHQRNKLLKRGRPTHQKARKLPISQNWVEITARREGWDETLTRRVQLHGVPEEAIPNYSAATDPEGDRQLVNVRSGAQNELNEAIRQHVVYLETLTLNELDLPESTEDPSPSEIRAAFGTSHDIFQFHRNELVSDTHNCRARLLFAYDWVKRYNRGYFSLLVFPPNAGEMSVILLKITEHLSYLIRQEARLAAADSVDAQLLSNQNSRCAARRGYKSVTRTKAASLDPYLKSWEVFVKTCSGGGQSDEESEEEVVPTAKKVIWDVHTLPWRNPAATQMLHFLDAIVAAREERKKGFSLAVVRGAALKRERKYVDKMTKRDAPPKQYKDFYHPEFLEQIRVDGDLINYQIWPKFTLKLPAPGYYQQRAESAPNGHLLKTWTAHKNLCKICNTLEGVPPLVEG